MFIMLCNYKQTAVIHYFIVFSRVKVCSYNTDIHNISMTLQSIAPIHWHREGMIEVSGYIFYSFSVKGSFIYLGPRCVVMCVTLQTVMDTFDRDTPNAFAVFRSIPSSDREYSVRATCLFTSTGDLMLVVHHKVSKNFPYTFLSTLQGQLLLPQNYPTMLEFSLVSSNTFADVIS